MVTDTSNKKEWLGINYNSSLTNTRLPEGMVWNQPSADAVFPQISILTNQSSYEMVRTLVFLAEKDDVNSPWPHIPLRQYEQDSLWRYLDMFAYFPQIRKIQLAIAPLWEALWLFNDYGVNVKPDNPFTDLDEMVEAFMLTLSGIVKSIKTIRSKYPDMVFELDLYNESDVMHGVANTTAETHMEFMRKYYPLASDLCFKEGVDFTISTIIPPDCSTIRSRETFDFIQSIGKTPTFHSIHINGLTSDAIAQNICSVVNELNEYTDLPISVGECDVFPLSWNARAAIFDANGNGCFQFCEWPT